MTATCTRRCLFATLLLCAGGLAAQTQVTATVEVSPSSQHAAQSKSRVGVFWLEPITPRLVRELAWTQQTPYRLLQKNRMFSPHVLVVPIGATVVFPNADPFFHNVFSLFDGKRFDLGLYEAGVSRNVRFERPGISYIFCNIHPEMSGVVIALGTRLFATREIPDRFVIADVPAGEYEAHLWVEGEDEGALSPWTHRLIVTGQGVVDAGTFRASVRQIQPHANKFGQPYKSQSSTY